jgi:hypothetical protein
LHGLPPSPHRWWRRSGQPSREPPVNTKAAAAPLISKPVADAQDSFVASPEFQ